MTFPRLRALWAMLRSWGWLVQPDPTERLEGDTHSRKVSFLLPEHEAKGAAWNMAGLCASAGRPDLAADWVIVALTGTARTVEEEA